MIYASDFWSPALLSDDELPPWFIWFLGNFSDAALDSVFAAYFVDLGAASSGDLGNGVSSDAVKPLNRKHKLLAYAQFEAGLVFRRRESGPRART